MVNSTLESEPQSARKLLKAFASGAYSPRQAAENALARIDKFDAKVNAFSFVDYEGALRAADESTARWQSGQPCGLLDGVPTTIKDIVWAEGWKTTYGSAVIEDPKPAVTDAPCVARLREAGAVLLGMTTTPELGWKGVTDSPLHGITRNPWNTSRTPGGSSGGAAAAAALNMGSLHIGTDGGGSIRMPAAFTGIVGHKPSFGRVPAYPMSAFGTVAHIGPMTRTVEDAALMLQVLEGPDSRDWYALPSREIDYLVEIERPLTGLNIAYSKDLGFVDVDPEVAALVERALSRFEDMGARVEWVDAPFEKPQEIFHALWFVGAANRFGALDQAQQQQLDPGLREVIDIGQRYCLSDHFSAGRARAELGAQMKQFHQKWDLLLTPALPFAAFEAGRETPSGQGRWTDWAGFNYPFNLTQQPACSVPCGLTAEGLPVGLQIVGPMFGDAAVLNAAHQLERTCNWQLPASPRP